MARNAAEIVADVWYMYTCQDTNRFQVGITVL
jgi:hypothetical protein